MEMKPRIPGTQIELIQACQGRRPRIALFDFDGTLSLIREGWQQIMEPMFVEQLSQTGSGESPQQLLEIVRRFVMELTGKQTIYQMLRLCEEIRLRGGQPLDPVDYKREYHRRLMQRIDARREALRSGECSPEQWLVAGSRSLLERLRREGVQMFLASGTDVEFVREEVELLGLGEYFGERVYGAVDDYRSFSKAQVIQRLLAEHQIAGSELIGFGDGYVEIENVRQVGGLTVAVASDESGRSGRCDEWKRARLLEVGADVVVPDFQEAQQLVDWIWKEPVNAV